MPIIMYNGNMTSQTGCGRHPQAKGKTMIKTLRTPKGWKVVDYRAPKKGETILYKGNALYMDSLLTIYGFSVYEAYILERIQ